MRRRIWEYSNMRDTLREGGGGTNGRMLAKVCNCFELFANACTRHYPYPIPIQSNAIGQKGPAMQCYPIQSNACPRYRMLAYPIQRRLLEACKPLQTFAQCLPMLANWCAVGQRNALDGAQYTRQDERVGNASAMQRSGIKKPHTGRGD